MQACNKGLELGSCIWPVRTWKLSQVLGRISVHSQQAAVPRFVLSCGQADYEVLSCRLL